MAESVCRSFTGEANCSNLCVQGRRGRNMAAQTETGSYPRLSFTSPKVNSDSITNNLKLTLRTQQQCQSTRLHQDLKHLQRHLACKLSEQPSIHFCGHSDFRKQQTLKFQDQHAKVFRSQMPPTASCQRIVARQPSFVTCVFCFSAIIA